MSRTRWSLVDFIALARLRKQEKSYREIRDERFPERTVASVRSAAGTDRYAEVAGQIQSQSDVFPGELPKQPFNILGIDIETSPNTAYVWGLFKQTVSLNQLLESSRVMCFAAKWFGTDLPAEFHSEQHDNHEGMIRAAWHLLDEADAVVHFFGSRFDIPTLNKEFLKLGLNPPSPYAQIDLIKTARSQFKFASNKLDHILSELGLAPKVQHGGFKLWVDCMNGCPDAWKNMETYNVQDVVAMEPLYQRLLPWITNHPNVALYKGTLSAPTCPKCGSTRLMSRGLQRTKVALYRRFQCKDCASWSQARTREVRDDQPGNVLKEIVRG
jgi:DNA polymerase elongation subunit (family B)